MHLICQALPGMFLDIPGLMQKYLFRFGNYRNIAAARLFYRKDEGVGCMPERPNIYHTASRFTAGVRRRDLPSQAIADALKDGLKTTSSNINEDTFWNF